MPQLVGYRRKRMRAASRYLALDPRENFVRLSDAPSTGEPTRRLGKQAAKRYRNDGGDRSDYEHPLPSKERHHPTRDHSAPQQTDRVKRLVDKCESTSPACIGPFVDIGDNHWDLSP